MHLSTQTKEHYTIIAIQGRLDSITADDFQASLGMLIERGQTFLIVDCKSLEFLSSAGMRSILICAQAVKQRSGRLIFSGFSEQTVEVLEFSGIGKYLESYSQLEQAEQAMYTTRAPPASTF